MAGCMAMIAPPDDEGDIEGGPGRPRMYISFPSVFSFVPPFVSILLRPGMGGKGGPTVTTVCYEALRECAGLRNLGKCT